MPRNGNDTCNIATVLGIALGFVTVGSILVAFYSLCAQERFARRLNQQVLLTTTSSTTAGKKTLYVSPSQLQLWKLAVDKIEAETATLSKLPPAAFSQRMTAVISQLGHAASFIMNKIDQLDSSGTAITSVTVTGTGTHPGTGTHADTGHAGTGHAGTDTHAGTGTVTPIVNPKAELFSGGKLPQLYGWWYYYESANNLCKDPNFPYKGTTQSQYDPKKPMINCVDLKTSIGPISGAKENAAFYLGSGGKKINPKNKGLSAWYVKEAPAAKGANIKYKFINFGGWGDCTYSKDQFSTCNTAASGTEGTMSKKCVANRGLPHVPVESGGDPNKPQGGAAIAGTSSGPAVVWTNSDIENLPSAQDIIDQGYNGASIDIEGVDNLDGAIVSKKLKQWKDAKLLTMITIPGYGVKWGAKSKGQDAPVADDTDAMGWMKQVAADGNMDYVCLMYYALIKDTECDAGGCTPAAIQTSLKTYNTTYGIKPENIVLGISFGQTESPTKYFTPDTIKLASGGVTNWAKHGGESVTY